VRESEREGWGCSVGQGCSGIYYGARRRCGGMAGEKRPASMPVKAIDWVPRD
jgi:hypothetical protein